MALTRGIGAWGSTVWELEKKHYFTTSSPEHVTTSDAHVVQHQAAPNAELPICQVQGVSLCPACSEWSICPHLPIVDQTIVDVLLGPYSSEMYGHWGTAWSMMQEVGTQSPDHRIEQC